jgi:hypothetical protein
MGVFYARNRKLLGSGKVSKDSSHSSTNTDATSMVRWKETSSEAAAFEACAISSRE